MPREIHTIKGNSDNQLAGAVWSDNLIPITLHDLNSSFWNFTPTGGTASVTGTPVSQSNQLVSHAVGGSAGGTFGARDITSDIVAGNFYAVRINVTSVTGVPFRNFARLNNAPASGDQGMVITSTGEWCFVFEAAAAQGDLRIGLGCNGAETAGVVIEYDTISMYEVTGLTDPGPRIGPPGTVAPANQTNSDTLSANLVTRVDGSTIPTLVERNTILNLGNSFSHKSALDWQDYMLDNIDSAIIYNSSSSGRTLATTLTLADDSIARTGIEADIVQPLGVGILQECINSINAEVALATMQTQALAIIQKMLDDGELPMLINCSPFAATGSKETLRNDYNAWLDTLPYPVADISTALKDGGDPSILAAIYDSGDGTHLTDAGYQVMGLLAFQAWELVDLGSSSVRKLYRHSNPLTGRGMGDKHTSPLIKVKR